MNLATASRSSLLFDGTAGLDDPLTGARVTVLGELTPDPDPRRLQRFIARHPAAALYGSFHDFQLYRMHVERAHLIAGFGRIHWIEGADLIYPADTEWLRNSEAGALDHMNKDHAAAIDLYAQQLLGLAGSGWGLTGIDPEGADLRRSGSVARLAFSAPVENLDAVRHVFAALAQSARRGAMSQ
jgi:putative heme iron utilization protein